MKFFQPFDRAHGMDISDYKIRIAECSPSVDGLIIYGFGEIELETGIISEGEIKDFQKAEKKVEELYKKTVGKIGSPFVIVAIPERKTFTKVVEIDTLPQDQLSEAVKYEAEQHFPIALEDVYTTWSLVSETNEKQKILLSATDKLYVQQYITLLESMNKHVIIAEPESSAMQRFLMQDTETPTIILDLGASKTTADIVVNGIIRYTSTINFTGKELTEAVSRELNLDAKQAERAKLLFGLDKVKSKGVIRKVLEPHFSSLIQHLKDILDYYENQFEGLPPIQQILLCGGSSRMEGMMGFIENKLSIPTHLVLPAINEKKGVGKHFPIEKEISFVTTFGLSLRTHTQTPFDMIK